MSVELLGRIQRCLQAIYDIRVPVEIGDFVFSDPVIAKQLGVNRRAGTKNECLLLRDLDGNLDVSLYFSQALLEKFRVAESRPDCSSDISLDELHLLFEGVSHFVFLVWNAHHERQVAPFDLEFQGEIDKFVLSMFEQLPASGKMDARPLMKRQFHTARFDPGLDPEEFCRYRMASQMALAYCESLHRNYMRAPEFGVREILPELRRFYRLRRPDRFHRIAQHSA